MKARTKRFLEAILFSLFVSIVTMLPFFLYPDLVLKLPFPFLFYFTMQISLFLCYRGLRMRFYWVKA